MMKILHLVEKINWSGNSFQNTPLFGGEEKGKNVNQCNT